MKDLKEQLVRLGAERPDLRPHIRPVLAQFQKESAGEEYLPLVRATQQLFERHGYYTTIGNTQGFKGALRVFAISGSGPESLLVEFIPSRDGSLRVSITEDGRVRKSWTEDPNVEAGAVAKRIYQNMSRVL